jgi:hypothetical protein
VSDATVTPSAAEEPFDRRMPSPIAPVLELRASARSAVVVAGELTATQERSLVATGLEEAIVELATGADPPALVVVSGSAGGGKSTVIDQLAERRDVFADIVEDATHAESPDQEQYQRLVQFLAPLGDGEPDYDGEPLLVAMNVGMAIRFFDQLRRERGDDHGFTALEAALRRQLDLPLRESSEKVPGGTVVVNLDLRVTTGGADRLFQKMLAALDPDEPDGIMGGASRCATCRVRDFCFVRTNAAIASAEPARQILDGIADAVALDRGRPLQPRELWDLAADLVTGGARFAPGDPCDTIAALARADDGAATVWQRLLPNGAFYDPAGDVARALSERDPSFLPNDSAHTVLTRAGIDRAADGSELERLLGGVGREAVATAAGALARGKAVDEQGEYDRVAVGRGLVRAAFLAGEIDPVAGDGDVFRAALEQYADAGLGDEQLEELRRLVADALAIAFGVKIGADTFFFTRAYDSGRQHSILARADLLGESLLHLPPGDPARDACPEGAAIAGYRPLAVMFKLAGVPLRVDLPLYRLLELTRRGTKPSSADLERFFHLRRAAEALGRKIAADSSRVLLITDHRSGRRFRLEDRPNVRGNPVLGVTEVI